MNKNHQNYLKKQGFSQPETTNKLADGKVHNLENRKTIPFNSDKKLLNL